MMTMRRQMDFEYKMVIVARSDLKLSPGKLAAQVAHAAVACAFDTKKNNSKWFNKWQNEGGKKAIVKVDSEKDFYPLKEVIPRFHLAQKQFLVLVLRQVI